MCCARKENNNAGFVLCPFYIPPNTIMGWRIICFAVGGAGVASQPRDTILPSSTQDWGTLQPVILYFTSTHGWSLYAAVSLAVIVGSEACPGLMVQKYSVLQSVGGQDFRHVRESGLEGSDYWFHFASLQNLITLKAISSL